MEGSKLLNIIKLMDAAELMELIVLAKTEGEYERPLRAVIVYRSFVAIHKLLNEIERSKGGNCLEGLIYKPVELRNFICKNLKK